MTRILVPILLVVLLFPSFALGETMDDVVEKGKGFLCKITGLGCPASVDVKDLVKREDVYYKKFTTFPFTGKVTGNTQGSFKNGKQHGPWVEYWDNGQVLFKGAYKNGTLNGPFVQYHDNGQLGFKGTYKDGVRVE